MSTVDDAQNLSNEENALEEVDAGMRKQKDNFIQIDSPESCHHLVLGSFAAIAR